MANDQKSDNSRHNSPNTQDATSSKELNSETTTNNQKDTQNFGENDKIDHNDNSTDENLLVQKLKTELEENKQNQLMLLDEVKRLQSDLLSAIAEKENQYKRHKNEIKDVREYTISNFVKDLLEIIDNLSLTIKHKPKEMNEEVKNILMGIEMTQKQLWKVLANHNIQTINPKEGDAFDYKEHHAISKTATKDYDSDVIINVMQIGYKIKDRLLRPAMVTVSE